MEALLITGIAIGVAMAVVIALFTFIAPIVAKNTDRN